MCAKKFRLLFRCKHNDAESLIWIPERSENLSPDSEIGMAHMGALRCFSHAECDTAKLIYFHDAIPLKRKYRRHKISDRAESARRCKLDELTYTKATHRSGARRRISC